MKVLKTCNYKATNYNILPAILVTIKSNSFIIAFKLWNRHLGIEIGTQPSDIMSEYLGIG